MTNEWKEFKAYTGKPVYHASSKKDKTYMCRFTYKMIQKFTGFTRILTIIARGYLFHAKDGSLLPGDPRERIDVTLNALKAWCSVPDKNKSSVPPVDYRELSKDYPELVDEKGNGWYYRHIKNVFAYVKKYPSNVNASDVKNCDNMRNGFTKKWKDNVRKAQVPLFAFNTKGAWIVRFDDAIAAALEAGPLRTEEYVLPQEISDMLSIVCPEKVPVHVLKDIAAYYLANRQPDTDWVVLPVISFEAYYGDNSFSGKWLPKIPKSILERENRHGVCRMRMRMLQRP